MQRGLLLLSDRMKSITKIAHVQCYDCLYIPAGFNTDIPAATPQWVRLVPQERFGLLAKPSRPNPPMCHPRLPCSEGPRNPPFPDTTSPYATERA